MNELVDWVKHVPEYSTLQSLKGDWDFQGVQLDESEPMRRASRDSVTRWAQRYVDTHKLKENISFNVECVSAKQDAGTKLWTCTLRDVTAGNQWDVVSRSLCVCTGVENLPKVPAFAGDATAEMPIVHNLAVRSGDDLPKDEVLVIGAGPSAMDICQEAYRAGTKRAYLVSRRAQLGLPDTWPVPYGRGEMEFTRFLFTTLKIPVFLFNWIMYLQSSLWAWLNGVPAWKPVGINMTKDGGYVVRSELLPAIREGRLVPLISEIDSIEGEEVRLKNGMTLHPRKIVCATGWLLDLKFLSFYREIDIKDLRPKLLARFIDIDHEGLFFISGAMGATSPPHNADMLSRATIEVLTGEWKRPSDKVIQENIKDFVLDGIPLSGLNERELRRLGFKLKNLFL